jgi:hypothetical protein
MTISTKFKKDINTLQSAVKGDFFLDVKNPKLYKKIRKFYQNNGVEFSGDPLDDYDILTALPPKFQDLQRYNQSGYHSHQVDHQKTQHHCSDKIYGSSCKVSDSLHRDRNHHRQQIGEC